MVLAGTGDQGGSGICDQGVRACDALVDAGLVDAQSQVGSDSQVDAGGRVPRGRCGSGGLGRKERRVAAPQLQPH